MNPIIVMKIDESFGTLKIRELTGTKRETNVIPFQFSIGSCPESYRGFAGRVPLCKFPSIR